MKTIFNILSTLFLIFGFTVGILFLAFRFLHHTITTPSAIVAGILAVIIYSGIIVIWRKD